MDALEFKWRPRASVNVADHRTKAVPAGLVRGSALTATRRAALIRHELATALDYRTRCESRPTTGPWAIQMRDDNSGEVERLQAELSEALSGDLESR